MSVRRAVEINCDGCGNAWTDYGRASELRERMRADGWATALAGGKDLCSDCRPQHSAPEGADERNGHG
jgi:hypothetical protein